MTLNEQEQQHHKKLKEVLQQEGNPSNLEHLAATLLSRLLDVPFPVAKSGGYQHGGDAEQQDIKGEGFAPNARSIVTPVL